MDGTGFAMSTSDKAVPTFGIVGRSGASIFFVEELARQFPPNCGVNGRELPMLISRTMLIASSQSLGTGNLSRIAHDTGKTSGLNNWANVVQDGASDR